MSIRELSISYRWLPYGVGLLIVVPVSVGLLLLTTTTPSVNDTMGYVYAGIRIAEGFGPTYSNIYNQEIAPYFSLMAFQVVRENGLLVYLGFPPGFPLLLAAAVKITSSENAVHYTVPILAIVALISTFALGVLVSDNRWNGVWAILLMVAAPAYWDFGTAAWSEMPSMALIAGGTALFLWSRKSDSSNYMILVSLIGGMLLGFSLFVRYSNIAVFPAFALFDLWVERSSVFRKRQLYPFYLPLILAVLAIPLFNSYYYGGPTITSYSPVHGWYPHSPFSLSYALGPSFVNGYSFYGLGTMLWENFGVAMILIPLGWFLLPRGTAILTAFATLLTAALYSVYAFSPTGVNSRFLLPVFPFMCISIAQVLVWIGIRVPDRRLRYGLGVVIAIFLTMPIPSKLTDLQERNQGYQDQAQRVQELVAFALEPSVFLSYVFNDHIIYYSDHSVLNYRRIPESDPESQSFRGEMLEPCMVLSVSRLLAAGTPVYYVLDSDPSAWGTLEMLDTYLDLEIVREAPAIYSVTPDPQMSTEGLKCEKLTSL